MNFDVAAMTRRAGVRTRGDVVLAPIEPTMAQRGELAGIYLAVVREWQRQARAVILPAYQSTMAELANGIRDSAKLSDDISNVRNAQEGAAAGVERLLLTLTPLVRGWAQRFERWHRSKWIRLVAGSTAVDLSTLVGPEDARETLESVVARNVALVRSVSDETRARIADIVFRGFQTRRPFRDVAREIRQATGLARDRALRIASDQTVKLASVLDTERMQQAGIKDWRWQHSGKVNYRPEHKRRNGRVYSFKNPPADMPGELPFCGCKKQAVIRLSSGRFSR